MSWGKFLLVKLAVMLPAFGSLPLFAAEPDSVTISVLPYASIRGQVSGYAGKVALQDNASRLGVLLDVAKKNARFLAGVEVQLNMFKGGSSFNLDADLAGEFLVVQTRQEQPVFAGRLGYLGVDLRKYGSLTLGKQWSVYRDITAFTDYFNVFGGRASGTFIGGTDGGQTGTGRADQSVIYRNTIGRVQLGLQLQAMGSNNGYFLDGFGLSSRVAITRNLDAGMAFSRVLLSKTLIANHKVVGLSGHPGYVSAGVKYYNKRMHIGLVAILQENGDFVRGRMYDPVLGPLEPTVVFGAGGIEVAGRYNMGKLAILAGYNLYMPHMKKLSSLSVENPLAAGFQRNDIITGIIYYPIRDVAVYYEQRISLGRTETGTRELNVFSLGLRIDVKKQHTSVYSY